MSCQTKLEFRLFCKRRKFSIDRVVCWDQRAKVVGAILLDGYQQPFFGTLEESEIGGLSTADNNSLATPDQVREMIGMKAENTITEDGEVE
jgi:hypothetical protein